MIVIRRINCILGGILLASTIVTASCGGHPSPTDTSGSEEPPPDLSAFEESPPADVIPAPQLCDPEAPSFSNLGEPKSVDAAIGVAFEVEALNEDGQTFTLTFAGGSEEVVLADIANTQVCLEALPFEGTSTYEPDPSVADVVVAAVAEESAKSVGQLADYRDEQIATGSPSLADIANHFGADIELVRAKARQEIASSLLNVTSNQADEAIGTILDQAYAPFLVNPAELPVDQRRYDRLAGSGDIVIIEVELLDANLDGDTQLAIVFHFDPEVNLYRPPTVRYYDAKCQRSASVQLHAKIGSMAVHFWRGSPFSKIGSSYASARYLPDPKRLAFSPATGEYRYGIRVKGWHDGSWYSLDGSWTLGKGSC